MAHQLTRSSRTGLGLAITLAASSFGRASLAQWSPLTGEWGKDDPADIRVMTWNVGDALTSSNIKTEALNNWSGLAVVIASVQPDIILFQEAGDNSGNGTGGGVDSPATLALVVDLLMNGGSDPFRGGAVGAFVAAYAPGYTPPAHVFVSGESDGFNRNVIVSRWPFADLNGDGIATRSDIPFVQNVSYAAGGDGGIRGFQFVEIDLPDEVYAGDLVVGNAHLKAFGDASSMQQRENAARNVAFFIDHYYNGAGTTTPDPLGVISDAPQPTSILGDDTAVIIGGDWNEDEATNGRKGPAEWLIRAQNTGGTDGTDRDRTDSTFDAATNPITGDPDTRGGSKLDYLAWQDAVVTQRRAWIFDTTTLNSVNAPPAIFAFPIPNFVLQFSGVASDHLPVVADFTAPLAPACASDINGDGVVNGGDVSNILNVFGATGAALPEDLNNDGVVNGGDISSVLNTFGPCP